MARPRKVLKGGLPHKKDCLCAYCTTNPLLSPADMTTPFIPYVGKPGFSGPSLFSEEKEVTNG